MVADLRRYLQRTPVLQLAAGLALAKAALAFLSYLVYSGVVVPISFGGGFDFGFGFGFFSAAGRTFEWLEPAAHLLVLGAVVALAYAVTRRSLEGCPHCLAEIPSGAPVCRSCTRDVPAAP